MASGRIPYIDQTTSVNAIPSSGGRVEAPDEVGRFLVGVGKLASDTFAERDRIEVMRHGERLSRGNVTKQYIARLIDLHCKWRCAPGIGMDFRDQPLVCLDNGSRIGVGCDVENPGSFRYAHR